MATAVTPQAITPETSAHIPPRWVLISLGVALAAGLAALFWLPGGTLMDRLRALDAGICGQIPSHSFYPDGQQLPLCARDTGIYLGVALSIISAFARGRGRSATLPRGWLAVVLLGAIAVMAVDGFNSFFNGLGLPYLYQPSNLLRLATGLLAGTAIAAFLVPVANSVLWRTDDPRPLYSSPGRLAMVTLSVLAIAFVVVASQAGIALYPIALLSSAGVVMALTLVNMSAGLMVTRRVGRFTTYSQVAPVFALALVLAVIELTALFFLKQSVMLAVGM